MPSAAVYLTHPRSAARSNTAVRLQAASVDQLAGQRIAIAGLGLLGASIAMRARALGAHVVGLDSDAAHAAYARTNGIVDAVAASLGALVEDVDALVLAVPVAEVIRLLELLQTQHPAAAAKLTWIIDVGSTKGTIVAAGAALANFIGTHPIAGSERRGPQAGRRDLFSGKPWVCTPCTGHEIPPELHEFIAAMGARTYIMDAREHDHVVARTSHLPQTLSTVLAAMLVDDELHGIFGTGLQSMTRLAASPFSVWESIFAGNHAEISAAIGETVRELEQFAALLDAGDAAALEKYFERAHRLLERTSNNRR